MISLTLYSEKHQISRDIRGWIKSYRGSCRFWLWTRANKRLNIQFAFSIIAIINLKTDLWLKRSESKLGSLPFCFESALTLAKSFQLSSIMLSTLLSILVLSIYFACLWNKTMSCWSLEPRSSLKESIKWELKHETLLPLTTATTTAAATATASATTTATTASTTTTASATEASTN